MLLIFDFTIHRHIGFYNFLLLANYRKCLQRNVANKKQKPGLFSTIIFVYLGKRTEHSDLSKVAVYVVIIHLSRS